jgi:hypothetical protein
LLARLVATQCRIQAVVVVLVEQSTIQVLLAR